MDRVPAISEILQVVGMAQPETGSKFYKFSVLLRGCKSQPTTLI
jgi:hypothetical protein